MRGSCRYLSFACMRKELGQKDTKCHKIIKRFGSRTSRGENKFPAFEQLAILRCVVPFYSEAICKYAVPFYFQIIRIHVISSCFQIADSSCVVSSLLFPPTGDSLACHLKQLYVSLWPACRVPVVPCKPRDMHTMTLLTCTPHDMHETCAIESTL